MAPYALLLRRHTTPVLFASASSVFELSDSMLLQVADADALPTFGHDVVHVAPVMLQVPFTGCGGQVVAALAVVQAALVMLHFMPVFGHVVVHADMSMLHFFACTGHVVA